MFALAHTKPNKAFDVDRRKKHTLSANRKSLRRVKFAERLADVHIHAQRSFRTAALCAPDEEGPNLRAGVSAHWVVPSTA